MTIQTAVLIETLVALGAEVKWSSWPRMVAGNPLAHTAVSTFVVSSGSSVTLIVLIVSHPPVVEATVSVIEPTAWNT